MITIKLKDQKLSDHSPLLPSAQTKATTIAKITKPMKSPSESITLLGVFVAASATQKPDLSTLCMPTLYSDIHTYSSKIYTRILIHIKYARMLK